MNMYINRVEQILVQIKDSLKKSWTQFSIGSFFNVSRSSVFRKIFFKLLKNYPEHKFHNFWSKFSTLKITTGYITLKNDIRFNFQPVNILRYNAYLVYFYYFVTVSTNKDLDSEQHV